MSQASIRALAWASRSALRCSFGLRFGCSRCILAASACLRVRVGSDLRTGWRRVTFTFPAPAGVLSGAPTPGVVSRVFWPLSSWLFFSSGTAAFPFGTVVPVFWSGSGTNRVRW